MTQNVRRYKDQDYEAVTTLYKSGELFGGQFDLARDSRERLAQTTNEDPDSLLVYEEHGKILGTISLITNARVAWLFRFAVAKSDKAEDVAQALYKKTRHILKSRGHTQILVYSDPNNEALNQRYRNLGMQSGNIYRCFWEEVAL